MNQLLLTMDGYMNSMDGSPHKSLLQLISASDCPEGKEFKWVSISLWSDIDIKYSASDFPEGKEFSEDSYHNYYAVNEFSNYLESKRMGYTPFNPPLPFHLDIPRNRYGHIVYKGLLLCIRDKVEIEFCVPPLPAHLQDADRAVMEVWQEAHTPNGTNGLRTYKLINIDRHLG